LTSAATTPPTNSSESRQFGLAHWMAQVLEECDRAQADFAKDPVHDLRVALRRCRSMADGLLAIDPCPEWKRMKKAGKQLFAALGQLRDVQVMTDWIEQLSSPDDPVGKLLAAHAAASEHSAKQSAQTALHQFDRKRWARWMEILPERTARIPVGGPVFLHMALERWTEAYALHGRALRTQSKVAWHTLRIGIKKLRYTVENFLPELHDAWIDDLKKLQDHLGEVHDLDVLWASAIRTSAFPSLQHRQQWHTRIFEERTKRIGKYREKMVGPSSLWKVWRKQLPHGEEIEAAAFARIKLWGRFLDPDPRHSRSVCRLALQLYDRLCRAGMVRADREYNLRSVLKIAATLHEVGRFKGAAKHHKRSSRMIREISPPLGYRAKELQLAAMVARYHRGALPSTSQSSFARLTAAQQRRTLLLAGILRLADSLESTHDGRVKKLVLVKQDSQLLVSVDGYDPRGPAAARVAVARHILETLYDLPVVVRPLNVNRDAAGLTLRAGNRDSASLFSTQDGRMGWRRTGSVGNQAKISGSRSLKKAV
jgi:CHAD domain-containing protein